MIASSFLNYTIGLKINNPAVGLNRGFTEISLLSESVFNSLTYMFPLLSGTGYKTMNKPILLLEFRVSHNN